MMRYRACRFLLALLIPCWMISFSALDPVQAADDERDAFQASAYLGLGIDSFAASEVKTYLNPEASSDVLERGVAGFDFEYRLVNSTEDALQLWVLGETIHGVRSAEVDCQSNPEVPVCQDGGFDPNNLSAGTVYILRKATSLEGFLGFRLEFLRLQKGEENSPAKLYATARAGFLTVEKNGGDVVNLHHLGLGALATSGRYEGSYLEVGHGRTDLFLDHPRDRWKIDGYLSWKPEKLGGVGISPFAQIVVDVDLGDGSDSIQSYFGLNFDLDRLFGN